MEETFIYACSHCNHYFVYPSNDVSPSDGARSSHRCPDGHIEDRFAFIDVPVFLKRYLDDLEAFEDYRRGLAHENVE